MTKENKLHIELEQDWENISGVSEKARANVKVYIFNKGITFDGNSDRFDVKPAWITLSKKDAILLAKQILAFYDQLSWELIK